MTHVPTTHGLKSADLHPASIEKDVIEIQTCEARIAELEARLASTLAELSDVRTSLAATTRTVEWKCLMAQVEKCAEAAKLSADVEDAAERFRLSLQAPADYDANEISYSDTDDYADVGPLETVFEDMTATIEERIDTNAAKHGHALVQHATSTSRKAAWSAANTGDVSSLATRPHPIVPDPKDNQAVERFRAMLLLLVLSVHAGGLEKECHIDSIPDPSNRPMAALEEIRENVASLWSKVLITTPALTETERELWQHVATTFLGPPFDPSASS